MPGFEWFVRGFRSTSVVMALHSWANTTTGLGSERKGSHFEDEGLPKKYKYLGRYLPSINLEYTVGMELIYPRSPYRDVCD